MILAIVIFAITLVLILLRPKPLNEGTAAVLGAIAILAAGVVSPADAFDVLKATDNILLFFLGLMVISTVTDQAGVSSSGVPRRPWGWPREAHGDFCS